MKKILCFAVDLEKENVYQKIISTLLFDHRSSFRFTQLFNQTRMGTRSSIAIQILAFFIILTSCKKQEAEQTDNLDQYGIFGQWKLEARSVNGVSDLSVQCCDYIEFIADAKLDDLKGAFTASGLGYSSDGAFELNLSSDSIQFDYADKQKVFQFQVSGDQVTFTYFDAGDRIIEAWRKPE